MYTYDEWGNTVFHIQTGKGGVELLEKFGISNTMTDEEYKKHMDSYRRIKQKENDRLQEWIDEFIKWCKT